MAKKEHDYNIFQKFVEEMIRTDTIVTNAGVFEVKGKSYILIAEIKEINSKPQASPKKAQSPNSNFKENLGDSPKEDYHTCTTCNKKIPYCGFCSEDCHNKYYDNLSS